MFHRTLYRLCLLPLIAYIASGAAQKSYAQLLTAAERATWSQKLTNLIPASLEGSRTVSDLSVLRADDMYQVIADNWSALSNSDVKQYILSCVAQNDNDRILDILQLGITDSSLAVQNRSLQFCESYGFDSFTEDFSAYQAWRKRSEGKPLKEVINESMKSVVAMLPTVDDAHRSALLNILVRTNLTATSRTSRIRREAALAAGLPEALVPWIKQQNNFMWTAYQIIRNLHPDEPFVRHEIMPLTDARVDSAVRYQALSALGMEQNSWAAGPLMKMMIAEYPDAAAEIIGQTLAQIGNPHVVPPLIGLMESDNTPEGNRVIGNILSPLTGVSNAYVRDAVWWRAWWTKNSARFPTDIRAIGIPKLLVRARPVIVPGQNGFQEPLRPTLRQVANDPKRAYWLIEPMLQGGRAAQATRRRFSGSVLVSAAASGMRINTEQPPPPPAVRPPQQGPSANANTHPDGLGLIVVLTADGDAASASGFWHDAAMRGLERQYYVAVVVAPKWTETPQPIWITGADMKSFKDAKFSTESLVEDVVKDVASIRKIDASRVFLHGIGSGGSAVYAASLDEKSPFHGFYVLNASFKSTALPPLDRANGRRYLIQNGKDDRTHPYWTAEAAQKLLVQKGAMVKLEPSIGYLGSQTPEAVMAQLKASFDWLAAGR